MKTIFLSTKRSDVFKTWSLAHTPAENDDDPADGGSAVAIRVLAPVEPAEQPHRPWQVQGVGNAL
jgi:hypothetical protein